MKKIALALALLAPLPALAHPGGPLEHGLLDGLMHPLTGLDHLAAMFALGLWAGMLGGARRLALPAGFLGAMALGLLLPLALPVVEAGVLASAVVLVVFAALAVRLPLMAALGVTALAGLLHGHAHALEGAGAGYMLGALAGSAALVALGVALAAPIVARRAQA